MGTADIVLLIVATMLSKLVLLAWAIMWLKRKAESDEAWEHENAWDSGWSEREDPGAESWDLNDLPDPHPQREPSV